MLPGQNREIQSLKERITIGGLVEETRATSDMLMTHELESEEDTLKRPIGKVKEQQRIQQSGNKL